MKDNWYIILELEFDPNPVHDYEGIIKAKIKEKESFWAGSFNDINRGAEYRRYHQLVPKMHTAMNDPEERKRLVKEACEIIYAPIDKLVKMVGRKGEISEDEIAKIASQQKTKAEIVKSRVVTLGFKIAAARGENFKALYDKYYMEKPKNTAAFDDMQVLLKTFGVDNLYDFLVMGTSLKDIEASPSDDLRKMASDKRKKEFYKNDNISGTGQKLCSHCQTVFENDASKALYDNYLEYMRRRAVLNEVKALADISGELTLVQGEAFAAHLTEIFKDRKLSLDLLTAFCKVEKIPYSPSKSEGKFIVCRICGISNDVTDGSRKICQSCAMELYIKCPKCEAVNEASIKVCKCGFKLDNIDKAIALCNFAEASINKLDFPAAEAYMASAEKYWPANLRLNTLAKHLSEIKARGGTLAESMKKAAAEKRFNEAKKQYDNIRKLFPEFRDGELENEMEEAFRSASLALNQARSARSEEEKISFCIRAFDFCKDYPGVEELIPPPLPPENLKITLDTRARANILAWEKSPSSGAVSYSVTRKKDSCPLSKSDGEELGRTALCEFVDRNLDSAAAYFYAVFTERAGVFSKPLVNGRAATNLFETSGLSISAADSMLELKWDAMPAGAKAVVYRVSASDAEEKITSTGQHSFEDRGLKNGELYSYIVRLEYDAGRMKLETQGLKISGSPMKPPMPIESLTLKPKDENSFSAVWTNPDNHDVELYYSAVKPPHNKGELVSLELFERNMKRLVISRVTGSEAVFQHTGRESIYVMPVLIKSGSVVCGVIARAGRGDMVKVERVTAANGRIIIYIEPPRSAEAFLVLYRFDKYPEDVDDAKSFKKHITLKQYLHDSVLVMDSFEKKPYYFTIFAELNRGGEKDYSAGTNFLFQNSEKEIISYSINVSKKIFGEASVLVEFKAENESFYLPDIEIMYSSGTTPMFKALAKPFYDIKAKNVFGSMQVKIPFPKGLPKDTYIKAFLKDESKNSMYQLNLNLKSKFRIN